MTLYDETIAMVRALAARARTTENVLFCEQRPLTSLEAQFAGVEDLASDLRAIEDDAIRSLKHIFQCEVEVEFNTNSGGVNQGDLLVFVQGSPHLLIARDEFAFAMSDRQLDVAHAFGPDAAAGRRA